jgi:hypothetical protein
MKKRFIALIALLTLVTGALISNAQEIQPRTTPEPSAGLALTWPPPVYVLRGTAEIRGSADLLNMSNYFVEFRQIDLTDTATDTDDEPAWFPATLPRSQPVQDGVLGTWNTETTQDGLYALRLVINISGGEAQTYIVSPVRVENNPPDFVQLQPTPDVQRTLAPTPDTTRPTIAPTPTPPPSQPQVEAVVDANVRRGDSTQYPRVGFLLDGETAPVLGISPAGWYYVELEEGDRGFIAPSTVRFSGVEGRLTLIQPPATPTPIPTDTPVPTGNLQITGLRLDPATPTCNQPFDVRINVQNTGSGRTGSSSTLNVVDRAVRTGGQQGSTVGGFPQLDPGESFVVVTTLTINTFFGEDHTVTVTLDPNNQVVETNEGDNTRSITYTLQQGGC